MYIMDNITTEMSSTFKEELIKRVKDVVRPKEGACGICHAVAEEICHAGGRIVAYEQPGGILVKIFDDQGNVIGEGFGVVWSPAVLAAELGAGQIPRMLPRDFGGKASTPRRTSTWWPTCTAMGEC